MLLNDVQYIKVLCFMQVGEVGELSEIFQWKGEVPRGLPGWEEREKEHLGEELSDVLLYLIRLSDICGIDLGKAALRKMKLNAIKYPAKLCKGSSKKYNGLSDNTCELESKTSHDEKLFWTACEASLFLSLASLWHVYS